MRYAIRCALLIYGNEAADSQMSKQDQDTEMAAYFACGRKESR